MKTLEDELSNRIIGAGIEVHRTLGGPGLLERVYEEALRHELDLRLALVLNFGKRLLREGVHRVVWKL